MILYFSGTGNSLYAAKQVAEQTGDTLMDIAGMVRNKELDIELGEDEHLGFVFPVYYYGIPTIIRYLISHLNIRGNQEPYTFAVLTCGGSIAGAGLMLEEIFKKNFFRLDRVFPLLMPDNYVILFNPATPEQAAEILKVTDSLLEDMIQDVQERNGAKISASLKDIALTRTAYPFYVRGRKTKSFHADDSCTGCGKCKKICPSMAIAMEDGKPKWVKEQCIYCLACINCCPEEAIQYGKMTKRRRRYWNPLV